MKGLLLAGGHGTRLRPLTFSGNKHLLPIANKPMILYGLQHLINSGIKEVGVILGPVKEGVVELLGDGTQFGADITYIDQPEPKGLAHAVLTAKRFLQGEPFVMYLGDNLLRQGARPLVDMFNSNNSDCVIGVTKVKDPSRYGIVVFNKKGKVERLVEKPKDPVSDWALTGVYVFGERIFDAARRIKPSWRGELEITEAIQTLLDQGAKIDVQYIQGWWKDTGKPEDLLEANQLILQELQASIRGVVEPGATVSSNICVGEGSVVHDRTTIRGPAIIGDHCEIGPNVYIGPYTSIGNDATVRNSEVENSIIMDKAYIDCGKRVVDSLVGRQARIVSYEGNVPRGYKLVLGDMSHVSL